MNPLNKLFSLLVRGPGVGDGGPAPQLPGGGGGVQQALRDAGLLHGGRVHAGAVHVAQLHHARWLARIVRGRDDLWYVLKEFLYDYLV